MSPGASPWLLTLAWCLLAAADAGAQPRSAAGEREVVLPEGPEATAPEIRVPAMGTVIRFLDASIDPETVALEGQGTRVDLFDKSTRSLIVVPLSGQGGAGRLRLEVDLIGADGPTRAVLTLVLGAAEADARVAVVRRPGAGAGLEAQLREAHTRLAAREAELQSCLARVEAAAPAALALQDLLDERGVVGELGGKDRTDGLSGFSSMGYRATAWALVAVDIENEGQEPWTPVEARLVQAGTSKAVRVLGIRMKVPRIAPGAKGRVVVETGKPGWLWGTRFHLELRDAAGRGLLIPEVFL